MTTYSHIAAFSRKLTATCLVATLLASCGPTPKPNIEEPQQAYLSLEDINAMLIEADTREASVKSDMYLDACMSLLEYGEYDWARNTLAALQPNTLSSAQYVRYSILSAKLAFAEGNNYRAKRYLWDGRFLQALKSEPTAKQIQARELRATLLYHIAEYRQAVEERIAMEELLKLDRDMAEFNQDLIWQALMALPLVDLQLEAQTHSDPLLKGWYRLAAISKDNQRNIKQQLRAVQNWTYNWPEHPASLRLPVDLQLLQQLVEQQPQRIAILLPLSGRLEQAAQTVLDGFMAAFYQTQNLGEPTPEILVYNTADGDINSLYDQAVVNGAELVIGPLDKDKIAQLYLRQNLAVPTLALNYVDPRVQASKRQALKGQTLPPANSTDVSAEAGGDSNPSDANDEQSREAINADQKIAPLTNQLFQFGLAIEDEAQQVAEQAFLDGHRRALILAPAGNWGDRSADTFAAHWLGLGGEIVSDNRFNSQKEYSSLIEAATGVKASKERARAIRRLTSESIEFEPRRRQDIDMVFMVARPSEARQLKPTLNFHYASAIPVYATSHIYNGTTNSTLDQDMNGIRFTTLPWFFDEELEERRETLRHGTQEPGSAYQPLYALGVDAYHLYPRLRQLASVKQAHFYGSTGNLSLDEQQRIVRHQVWAEFIRGNAHLVPAVSQDDHEQ